MKSWRCNTSKLLYSLPLWLTALWWGSLTTVGFLVVPLLFVHLPTPAMAGGMAAKLFTAQTTVSVVCGLVLLMLFRQKQAPALVDTAQSATLFVVGGVLLALLVEFGVTPHILARDNLVLWHRVGTGMYVVQWLCAGVVFGKLAKDR
ncbi:DUF4149 domain-containing protein [Candidatus Aalborgicola defluviihabitans]|uniref:DUF4149 domain-containing protein n=1 Tax=Candidatus Aalborgicola defluviihabitans TaxID=3386187 RepID=UPI001D931022|nr:DUF4149 domain-containing protein [Burkholderiales bacterium]MBK6568260.1 DUF4149 domain-containing protein [Burkholderiales bacterium]MBK7280462.1 DUF4149 domain-containing protein [Burkholderiales bacterium]MBK7313398.1 DUF4149 domain-containing protein [Burkholderiales bacterium]MBL0244672.1 DUF4149 domain-containing protein [Rhodoferax sp.]